MGLRSRPGGRGLEGVRRLGACRTLQFGATQRGTDPPKGRRPQVRDSYGAIWNPLWASWRLTHRPAARVLSADPFPLPAGSLRLAESDRLIGPRSPAVRESPILTSSD